MSLDSANGPEASSYKSWFKDPEQVENLVTLLEATTTLPADKDVQWKYGRHYLYEVMFPKKSTEWEPAYTRAPAPSSLESFEVSMSQLANGSKKFGADIPLELVERFQKVIRERGSVKVPNKRDGSESSQ